MISKKFMEKLEEQTAGFFKELAEFMATLPPKGPKGSPQNWNRAIAIRRKYDELEKKYPLMNFWYALGYAGWSRDVE